MAEDERPSGLPARAGGALRVDPRLLEILVCPVSKTTLEYAPAAHALVSRAAGLAFPIRDGIPIMLVEEATPIDPHAPLNRQG